MTRRVPLDPDLYADVVAEAQARFAVWPSAYASGWVVRTYKQRGGKYAGEARGEDTGLTKWFGEEWVDLSRPIYDEGGDLVGYEPCGRKKSTPQFSTRDYPKCRPIDEAMQMTPAQVKDAIRRKRTAEAKASPERGRKPVRVATYRRNPVESVQVEGHEREPYLESIWSMYVSSYSKIGLIVGRAEELLDEYDVWEVSVDETGTPRAFCLYKRTPFGLKVGLSGSDGSPEGRAVARASFATKYQRPGVYGEVSHRPAELARAAGVPVVCANVASVVLRKQIDPVDDVHYVRNLANVGPVQKMLVGMPLGVPTTDIQQPVCPAVRQNPPARSTPDDIADVDAHYASILGF